VPVHSISLDDLKSRNAEQTSAWCAMLEAGQVLYFPQTPVKIPDADIGFLLGQHQTESKHHKNIAYKPDRDKLTGIDTGSASSAAVEQMHSLMRRYSASVTAFLGDFLAPYTRRWILDYASYRPIEEENRDLPLRRRNDLLHTDAFPTRPTKGRRILRFFHNIHPDRTRDWLMGEPFSRILKEFVPANLPVPRPESAFTRAGKLAAAATGLAALVPQWKRTSYDEFMMRLHNAMKENEDFQRTCAKESFQFPAGSSWMVYTETVPHAVLAGRYALEQTFLVDPAAMVAPDSAPIRILEKMSGGRLA
jgi:hypothetical protein